jgi:hypothetical protein
LPNQQCYYQTPLEVEIDDESEKSCFKHVDQHPLYWSQDNILQPEAWPAACVPVVEDDLFAAMKPLIDHKHALFDSIAINPNTIFSGYDNADYRPPWTATVLLPKECVVAHDQIGTLDCDDGPETILHITTYFRPSTCAAKRPFAGGAFRLPLKDTEGCLLQ